MNIDHTHTKTNGSELDMNMTAVWDKLRKFPEKYLWRTPRTLFLRALKDSSTDFAKLIAGKRVAVVGNAQSLFIREFGSEIDRHDLIVRFNHGIPIYPVAQGTRTDIVSLNSLMSESEVMNGFRPKHLLFLTPRMRHYRIDSRAGVAITSFYPLKWWWDDRSNIGKRPSSGFMGISFILRANTAREVTVYGFDFGASYNDPVGYVSRHDFAKEAEIVRGWAKEGRLRLVE